MPHYKLKSFIMSPKGPEFKIEWDQKMGKVEYNICKCVIT